jgi:ribosomal protein S18 acetylase RimI-like enzyme
MKFSIENTKFGISLRASSTQPKILSLTTEHAFEVLNIIKEQSSKGTPQWSVQQVTDELRTAESLGLFLDSHLCAFVLFKILVPEQIDISFLATKVSVQRQSLMSKLIGELVLKLRDSSPFDAELWLEVHEQNLAARALYEKLSFAEVGTRQHYYSDSGHAILYSLKLKP